MRVYFPDIITQNSYIEAPCPVPSNSSLLVDVRYAFDVYGSFGNFPIEPQDVVKQVFVRHPLRAVKRFVELMCTHSLSHATKRMKNKVYREMEARYCSFVSVSGFVHSTADEITTFRKGDPIAAIGFLQPCLADFVLVPASLAVKLSNPSDGLLYLSSWLFVGSAAAYVVARCLGAQKSNTSLKITTIGQSPWIDITVAMLQRHYPGTASKNEFGRLHDQGSWINLEHNKIEDEHANVLSVGEGESLVSFQFGKNVGNGANLDFKLDSNRVCLHMPDPWFSDHLNLYSLQPFDLPEWCTRQYLEEYITFVERHNDCVKISSPHVHYCGGNHKNDSPVLILRKRCHHNRTLTAGVIGAGKFATAWLQRLLKTEGIRVRAVADRHAERAWLAAQTYDCEVCSTDANVVLNDKDIQIIFVITDHASHAPLAMTALNSGKIVYLEKPQAISFAQLKSLLEVIETRKGQLQVGYNRRYAPAVVMAKKWLQSKNTPLNISFTLRLYDVSPNSFYHWPEQGSRVVTNLCHHLDLAYHLIGKKPVLISAVGSPVGRNDENVVICGAFEDGSLCTISLGNQGDPSLRGREMIHIMRDNLTIDIDDYCKLSIWQNGSEVFRWKGSRDAGHQSCLKTFVERAASGQAQQYTSDDLYWSAMLYLTADKALKTERIERFR